MTQPKGLLRSKLEDMLHGLSVEIEGVVLDADKLSEIEQKYVDAIHQEIISPTLRLLNKAIDLLKESVPGSREQLLVLGAIDFLQGTLSYEGVGKALRDWCAKAEKERDMAKAEHQFEVHFTSDIDELGWVGKVPCKDVKGLVEYLCNLDIYETYPDDVYGAVSVRIWYRPKGQNMDDMDATAVKVIMRLAEIIVRKNDTEKRGKK